MHRLVALAHLAFTTLTCTIASGAFSSSIDTVALEFRSTYMVLTLCTSLFVFGFATGPCFWAPLCELKGRKYPLTLAMFGLCIFEIGTAVAHNVQTILICRLLGGMFAAGPMSITAATLSDIWSAQTRGTAISCFSMSVFIGPFLAPILGSYVTQSNLGWRWIHYILAMMSGASSITLLIVLKESYAPVLLVRKARKLRLLSGNSAYHAEHEATSLNLKDILHEYFARPIGLIFTEPILFFVSLYSAFIYGIIYLLQPTYIIVFNEVHRLSMRTSSLPFLGLVVGMLFGGLFVVCHQPSYTRRLRANKEITVPEWRLLPSMYGCIPFAGGIFWFGWTGYTQSIHWVFPAASGLMTGFGLFTLFLPCLNFLIDSYFDM